MSDNKGTSMQRSLGLKESVTITVGTVIGVGLFTVGANGVGYLGPTVIIATLVAFLVSIFPALLYGEMGSSLPYAGGTYNYASKGLGRVWGMLAGWNFVISLIAVASGEALAFSFYINTLLEALNINIVADERIIAAVVIIFFIVINWRGIEITGKLQNAFVFFFWGVAIVWFIMMIPKINLSYYVPFVSPGNGSIGGFIFTTSLIWWCFAGFETCCAMGEEIKYPQINIPRAIFLAPFIIFAVTATFQWFLLGIVPPSSLEAISQASAPYAEGMKQAGILGLPLIMLCAGVAFGGDMSTLNPCITAPARYLFSMSRDGSLPKFFSKLHPKYKTPYVAVLFLGIITMFFITTGSMIYIASLSLFADLFYYIIGFASVIGLRKKLPDLKRPYKAPAANVLAAISIIIYVIMMTQLPKDAFITGIVWCILGVVVFYALNKGKANSAEPVDIFVPAEEPTEKEREKLDKEYRLWRNVVMVAFVLSIACYLVPYILK